MSVKYIKYLGTEILFIDYSTCRNKKEMISVIHESRQFYDRSEGELRVLSDFTNALGSIEFMDQIKILNKQVGHKIIRAAVIGMDSALKEILLKGFNTTAITNVHSFQKKVEAMDYLAS